MVVIVADLAAPKAITAAARVVLQKMIQDPSRDEQTVVYDVINDENTASAIKLSGDQFEAVRMAVFLKYSALRAEAGLDDDDGGED